VAALVAGRKLVVRKMSSLYDVLALKSGHSCTVTTVQYSI
jgi:hypothetical protein